MDTITLSAYAKINLTLYITGKRADGYHTLSSVMQTVSLHDDVTVTGKASGISMVCPGIPEKDNIALKAARLFFSKSKINGGADININKRIPEKSGMGGGSADAAAVLRGLNHIYGRPFLTHDLAKIALELGTDVPFCVFGGTMLAEGVGEKLTPLPSLSDCVILLCAAEEKESTGIMYKKTDDMGITHALPGNEFSHALSLGDIGRIGAALHNDFEAVSGEKTRGLIHKMKIFSGCLGASLTGSGPYVYGVFDASTPYDRLWQELCGPIKVSPITMY